MRHIAVRAALPWAVLLAGCAAPTVTYLKLVTATTTARGYADSYYLNRADLVIALPASAAEPSVDVELGEYTAYKVGIVPQDSAWAKTTVNITKVDNTDRVSAIGVETTDRTVELVNQVGGLVGKVLGGSVLRTLDGAHPTRSDCEPTYPLRIPLFADRVTSHEDAMQFDPATGAPAPGGCIKLTWNKAPPDAVHAIPFGVETRRYYYAACRSATLRIGTFAKTMRLPDPTLIQAVNLPYKGSVQMHSVCGVSVTTDSSASPATALQVLDAIASNLQAIKDAKGK